MKRLFHHRFAGGCVSVEWEPRDLWLGAYWKRSFLGRLHIYLNFVPCLPIHVTLDSPADGWADGWADASQDYVVLSGVDGRRHVPPGSDAYVLISGSPDEMLARVVLADKTDDPEESPTDPGLTPEKEQDVPLPMHRGDSAPIRHAHHVRPSAIDGERAEEDDDG